MKTTGIRFWLEAQPVGEGGSANEAGTLPPTNSETYNVQKIFFQHLQNWDQQALRLRPPTPLLVGPEKGERVGCALHEQRPGCGSASVMEFLHPQPEFDLPQPQAIYHGHVAGRLDSDSPYIHITDSGHSGHMCHVSGRFCAEFIVVALSLEKKTPPGTKCTHPTDGPPAANRR